MVKTEQATSNDIFLECEAEGKEPTEILDDLVHTLSEKIASEKNPYCCGEDNYDEYMDIASLEASDINNKGSEAQIAYLEANGAGHETRNCLLNLLHDES